MLSSGVGALLALVVVLGELESTYGGDPGGRRVLGQPLLTRQGDEGPHQVGVVADLLPVVDGS